MKTLDDLLDDLLVLRETLGGDCAVVYALDDEGELAVGGGDVRAGWIEPRPEFAADPIPLYRVRADDDADAPGVRRALVLWGEEGAA